MSVDPAGEYRYRRARYAVPARSFGLLHPDEPHAVRSPQARERPAEFWLLYLPPERVRVAAGGDAVFFRDVVWTTPQLSTQFAALHARLEQTHLLRETRAPAPSAARLDRSARERAGRACAARTGRRSRALAMAFLPGLSGALPPAAACLSRACRIRRAKRLLAAGRSPAAVAFECGFADQSHFTRHFRRLVDVTRDVGVFNAGRIVISMTALSHPAIANAIFHATGVRVRELPVRPEMLL